MRVSWSAQTWVNKVFLQNKYAYNKVHPYWEFIPILSWYGQRRRRTAIIARYTVAIHCTGCGSATLRARCARGTFTSSRGGARSRLRATSLRHVPCPRARARARAFLRVRQAAVTGALQIHLLLAMNAKTVILPFGTRYRLLSMIVCAIVFGICSKLVERAAEHARSPPTLTPARPPAQLFDATVSFSLILAPEKAPLGEVAKRFGIAGLVLAGRGRTRAACAGWLSAPVQPRLWAASR